MSPGPAQGLERNCRWKRTSGMSAAAKSASTIFVMRLGSNLILTRILAPDAFGVMALVSVVLTFCAGLMAVAFWTLRGDFDLGWWIPNLYLVVWPLWAVRRLIR